MMTGDVVKLSVEGNPRSLPESLMRPCDYRSQCAIMDLETHLGTVEVYKRRVMQVVALRERIDSDDIKAQNPLYATDWKGNSPIERYIPA
jgi:hypothetical protein